MIPSCKLFIKHKSYKFWKWLGSTGCVFVRATVDVLDFLSILILSILSLIRLETSTSDNSVTVIISSSDIGADDDDDDTGVDDDVVDIDGIYPNFHVLLLSSLYHT